MEIICINVLLYALALVINNLACSTDSSVYGKIYVMFIDLLTSEINHLSAEIMQTEFKNYSRMVIFVMTLHYIIRGNGEAGARVNINFAIYWVAPI